MNSSIQTIPISIPIWIAVFYFATVHELAQSIAMILLGFASLYILATHAKKPPKKIVLLLCICVGFMLFGVIPVPISLHHQLQPNIANLSSVGLQEANAQWQPLALRPRNGLLGVLLFLSCSLFFWACSSFFYRIQRFYRLGKILIAMAIALCVLAWIQKATNAQSIYWISEIPSFSREPFFGSFVNPNHAGAFLAGILPLCFTLRSNTKLICFITMNT